MLKNIGKSTLHHIHQQTRKGLTRLGYHSRPAFLIIGAQKAGTSALFSMLAQHPQIVAPHKKEMAFFYDTEIIPGIRYGDFVAYHSQFPLPHRLTSGKMTFEATPDYLIYPECPKRIFDYAPEMKLIVILRDPVARAYSGWNMFRNFAKSAHVIAQLAESRTFEEAITAEIKLIEQGKPTRPWNYVSTGMYVEHLRRYFQYFSQDAVLILDHAHLLRAPDMCLAAVCKFLGINDAFQFEIIFKHVSRYESSIPEDAANLLRSFYRPLNASLFQLLNREFDWEKGTRAGND